MSNVVPFRRNRADDAHDTELATPGHGAELEVLQPSAVDMGAGWQSFGRPTLAGVRHRVRRGWSLTWRWLVWRTFVSLPVALAYCVRWLAFGLTHGVVDLARWCYAGDERREDKAGTGKTRKGAAVKSGSAADHLGWWRLGAVLVPPLFAWLVLWQFLVNEPEPSLAWLPDWAMYAWVLPYVVWATVYGHGKDRKPYTPPATPRLRTEATAVAMIAVLRANEILKPEPRTANAQMPGVVVQAAMPQDRGNVLRTLWDLPADCGKSAADVIAKRERLAGAFATKLEQFHVRLGAHPAQFEVLQFKRDPFGGPMPIHPLADAPSYDVWDGLPFGVGVLGDVEVVGLVFTSSLIGARPRRGKSFAARSKLAGAVLDPYVKWHVFNGKAGETWDAVRPFSEHYVAGADTAEIAQVCAGLEELVAIMREQHRAIRGSKLTRAQARDLNSPVWVRVVVVDEVQEYLPDPTYGARIESALVTLAKVGPSAGISLELITQKPDERSFPSTLRAVLGARYCLQVMSYHDSNVVLGPDMSKLGYDASKIQHRGVGILRPDEDANGQPDSFEHCRMVRTFAIGDEEGGEDWEAICRRGTQLRDDLLASTLELPEAELVTDDDTAAGARPMGLVRLVARTLCEHGDMSATGLLAALPEPWSALTPAQLGVELKAVGLSSVETHSGRRYRASEAVARVSQVRDDPVAPAVAPQTPPRGHHGGATGPATGPATGV